MLSQQTFSAPHQCHPCGTQKPAELLELLASHVDDLFTREANVNVHLLECLEDFCVLNEASAGSPPRLVSFDIHVRYSYPAEVHVGEVSVVSAKDRSEVFRFKTEESKGESGARDFEIPNVEFHVIDAGRILCSQ